MNNGVRLLLAGVLIAVLAGQPVHSLTMLSPEGRVNLLELYTSHGCSSCPPADAWLQTLEHHPGLWQQLIPMAFHVDYWDRLGWPDRFASAGFSKRQRDYQYSGALGTVYTPGFLLDGREWRGWVGGSKLDLPQTERVGRLRLQVDQGETVKARFSPAPHLEGIELQANLAILGFGLSSSIGGGENSGRTLEESFVVLSHSQRDATADSSEWQFQWPDYPAMGASRLAIVVWLNRAGAIAPIQAVGGWLPQDLRK